MYNTTPNREHCVFQELRKIGFRDYQDVFSRNEEKMNFKMLQFDGRIQKLKLVMQK